jgi:Uma2 family endonuclease
MWTTKDWMRAHLNENEKSWNNVINFVIARIIRIFVSKKNIFCESISVRMMVLKQSKRRRRRALFRRRKFDVLIESI